MVDNSDARKPYRASVPDTIIGIGDGGKQVLFTLLERDWILREALEPRDDNTNPGFNPVIVDSEGGDKDATRIAQINETIESKADDVGHPDNSTEVTYINLVDETTRQQRSAAGLTQGGSVRDITRGDGLRSWWLSNNDEMLGVQDNYSEGVERRRGLSKALYHAVRGRDDPFTGIAPGNGETAYIVVGLGGGTGSGTFIDLAKDLHEDGVTVHLVGILPNDNDNPQVKANAYAALSELEYLAMTDQLPFSNVLLFPFAASVDVEKYDEAIVNALMAHSNITGANEGFGNQTQYLSVNEPDGPNAFAPFTLVAPKTFHYKVTEVEEAKDEIESFIGKFGSAHGTEFDLYDRIEDLLENPEKDADHEGFDHPEATVPADVEQAATTAKNKARMSSGDKENLPDRFSLGQQEAQLLEYRLQRLEELLQADVFDEVSLIGPQALHDQIVTAKQKVRQEDGISETERIEQEIDHVGNVASGLNVQNLVKADDGSVSDMDLDLTREFKREVEAISKRADVLRTLHLLTDSDNRPLREGLQDATKFELENPAQSTLLIGRKDELVAETSDLENVVSGLDGAIENAEEYRATQLDKWTIEVEPDVETLITVDSNYRTVDDLISQLKSSIKQAVNEVNGPEEPRTQPLDFDAFEDLNRRLREVDVDSVDTTAIKTSLRNIAKMRRADLANPGPLERWRNKKSPKEQFEDAEPNVDPNYFDVPSTYGDSFRCEFTGQHELDEKLTKLEEKREEALEQVLDTLDSYTRNVKPFEELLDDPTVMADGSLDVDLGLKRTEKEYRNRTGAQLDDDGAGMFADGDASTIISSLTSEERADHRSIENVVYEAFDAAVVEPLRRAREGKKRELAETQIQSTLHERAYDILADEGSDYASNPPRDVELDADFDDDQSSEDPYKDRITPANRGRLTGDDHIGEADIFSIDAERKTLESKFQNRAEEIASGGEHAPITKPYVQRSAGDPDEAGNVVYDGHIVKTVFMSRTFRGDPKMADGTHFGGKIKDEYQENISFRDDNQGYGEFKVPFGDEWDLSMTTFIGGVFLDNITPVSATSNGYQSSYDQQRTQYRENIRIRHVHGVDGLDRYLDLGENEGAYIYRDRLITMRSSEMNKFIDNDESEMIDELLERMSVKRFDSPVDLFSGEEDQG